jgi:hypothetical protein
VVIPVPEPPKHLHPPLKPPQTNPSTRSNKTHGCARLVVQPTRGERTNEIGNGLSLYHQVRGQHVVANLGTAGGEVRGSGFGEGAVWSGVEWCGVNQVRSQHVVANLGTAGGEVRGKVGFGEGRCGVVWSGVV